MPGGSHPRSSQARGKQPLLLLTGRGVGQGPPSSGRCPQQRGPFPPATSLTRRLATVSKNSRFRPGQPSCVSSYKAARTDETAPGSAFCPGIQMEMRVGRLRFELRTNRLKAECSTAELATRAQCWAPGERITWRCPLPRLGRGSVQESRRSLFSRKARTVVRRVTTSPLTSMPSRSGQLP